MMEKALQYADIIVGCSSVHHQLAVQYRTGKIHHRLASLYHNALRNDASFTSFLQSLNWINININETFLFSHICN